MLNFVTIKQYCSLFFFILIIPVSQAQDGLLINEIMAHPSDSGDLSAEYIELYNNSTTTISLGNISLRVANTTIPLLDYFLAPKQYLILTSASNVPLMERYGTVMGLTSWRTLNNQAAEITLLSEQQEILDQVSYTDSWYSSAEKRAGEWSLERINPDLSCNNAATWIASVSLLGGSPGGQNSVWDRNFLPTLNLTVLDVQANSIVLRVENPLSRLSIDDSAEFRIEPGEVSIANHVLNNDTITLHLNRPLQADIPYELQINTIGYCGKIYQSRIPFIFASPMLYNDIIINEILFNPLEGSVDFVELYNRSEKTINLQNWTLGDRVITREPHFVLPESYRVLTTNAELVFTSYPTAVLENFVVMESLPTYTNERGSVTIYATNGNLIDSINYNSNMHQPFLRDVKGISLERQSFDTDGNASENFVSAATLSGGATPGYANSNQAEKQSDKNTLQLLSRTFSPDHDGFEDELRFTYAFTESNMMLSLTIFDGNGRAINRLIRNKSAGSAGEIRWGGLDESGRTCPGGIYVYQAEIVSSTGYYQTFKGSFVLAEGQKKY